MMTFFYFTEDVTVQYQEFKNVYEHKFEGVEGVSSSLSFDKIYFSTFSDFNNHMENLKRHGKFKDGLVNVIDSNKVINHEEFPKHIGFNKDFEDAVNQFRGRKEPLKVAILNAMSNAVGDHLIGMRAFDYWLKKIEATLGCEIEVTFFQLNPMRMAPITAQRKQLKEVYILPNKLSRFCEHDAFIDLGGLLLRPNFGNQPMIDFFLEAMSINPEEVPNEAKRIKFKTSPTAKQKIEGVLDIIRGKDRPILLFHHKSTTSIREMTPPRARQIIKSIIDKTDFFVVSAMELDFENERYLDISRFSLTSLHNFAAIIEGVDAVITVDTSTYHLADAFDTPTVTLFTTIEPEYRIKYYPFVDGMMLEKSNGLLYGRHKSDTNPANKISEDAYVDLMWNSLDIEEVLQRLEYVVQKRKDKNYERCDFSGRSRDEIVTIDQSNKQVSVADLQQADDLLSDSNDGGCGDQ